MRRTCLPLSLMAPTRKGIAVTRSLGRPVTQWPDMREACAHHASRAGEKLRAEGLVAARMRFPAHQPARSGRTLALGTVRRTHRTY